MEWLLNPSRRVDHVEVVEPNRLLRAVRERTPSRRLPGTPMSRQELAEAVSEWLWEKTDTRYDLDVNLVSKWERGDVRWPSSHYRTALRAVLGVATDRALGFCPHRRFVVTVDDVDRKNFLHVAMGVGASALTGRSLIDLVASSEPTPIPSSVGRGDIDEIRCAARAFSTLGASHGGLMREAVATQVRHCAELLRARCPQRLRSDLYSAVGDLGVVAGFMAFDVYAHHDAQRMFRFALACAEEAGDWHLRADVLACMARQAFWRGDIDASLTYVDSAQIRSDRLTATERSELATLRARALAKLGDVEGAVRAVGQADEQFTHSNPADDPPYAAFFDAAEHAGDTGHALADLALHRRFLDEATNRLRSAIAGYRAREARARAFCQFRLASLTMAVGDPREAATIGAKALPVVSTIRSRRLDNYLRDLHQASGQHTAIADVAELRERIHTVTREPL